ncbi:radical SAM protein [Thermincola potens]|uniref:Radical SAM domain protein n=1 Tax=Thermincola potens (strain JR) TaxID=635013 RepID=D5XAZ6_THEPJ|nr:radical SAM protein [Thermincola potens]ADG81316.1 Radical SAM domain protein [Thermincola potens JR]
MAKAKILLLEPNYKNKYPSLGLMKLATYHKNDEVYFRKGYLKAEDAQNLPFDRVYVSSLFTFEWKKTIDAIELAKKVVRDNNPNNVFLGGVAATLMADEFYVTTGVRVVKGLLTDDSKIGYNKGINIDALIPDYDIISQVEETQYKYPIKNSYIGYMTRGCKNKCGFCAVNTLEPEYVHYIPIKEQITQIDLKYGKKKDLVLMDNNVFASDSFFDIIDEIKELGFERGAKFQESPSKNKPYRYVDFNQGLDARFITPEKMKKLSEINIKPARIAFDSLEYKDIYIKAIELAAKNDIKHLSNYILYNYKDDPNDFYERLYINIELNERLGTSIYSFPMKYIPLSNKTRKYQGENWTKKQLRGVQCILNATMGKVGPKKDFFFAAFGENIEEFFEIINMPEDYIIYRKYNSRNSDIWRKQYRTLTKNQKEEFHNLIKDNTFKEDLLRKTIDNDIKKLLEHYLIKSEPPPKKNRGVN